MNPVDWSRFPVDPTGVRGGTEPDVAPGKPALGIGMDVAPSLGSYRSFKDTGAPGLSVAPLALGCEHVSLQPSPLGFATDIRTFTVLFVQLLDLGA
jgi:hypothetical protein